MNTRDILKRYHIKITNPRLAIYEILSEEHHGIDADYIYQKCMDKGLSLNLSTVYRTLDLFEEKNLLIRYDLGENKYHFSLVRHGHHHIVECEKCHKVTNLDCPMKQIEDLITKDTGFKLTGHHLEFTGICKDCQT